MSKWKNARSFVELAFAIDKHLPGYVDAYFGPAEIKESAESKGKMELEELSSALDQIVESTRQDGTLAEERREYLSAELKAMQTTVKILEGEDIDIIEEAQGVFGLTPTWTQESVFEEAHRTFEELLPGSGTLSERMERFEEKTIIPKEKLEPIIKNLADDFRRRTLEIVPLPEGEKCEYALVQDKPWSGYNWYLGKSASRIEINTDLPIFTSFLAALVAHEAYPGHHTENTLKEKALYLDRDYLEHSICPLNAPSSVISEGIATNALEMIATPDETIQIYQFILHQAGLKDVSGDQIYQIGEAKRALRNVFVNTIRRWCINQRAGAIHPTGVSA